MPRISKEDKEAIVKDTMKLRAANARLGKFDEEVKAKVIAEHNKKSMQKARDAREANKKS